MKYEQTINIKKTKADLIEALLSIDDIELYDGELNTYRDSCDLIARAIFPDGAEISICLMSGDTNYYTWSFFDGPNGEQDDGEPGYSFSDVEYENNGVKYILHFEVV